MMIGSINNSNYFNRLNYSNNTTNTLNISPLQEDPIQDSLYISDDAKDSEKKNGKVSPEECQTCKNRKYQDGSDESNVSFKNASHISPESAGAAVRSHEAEHVKNAYAKASSNNGKVINASVSIHTAVCPECGRTYVSGGTTNTQIKYYNESNPYQKDLKSSDSIKYRGANIDYVA